MTVTTSRLALTMFAAAALIATAITAMAQESGGPPSFMGGVGKGTGPSCPMTEWHIKPVPPTGAVAITGVAWFSDMSGISKIQGHRTSYGEIAGALISISGTGPTGPFVGQRTATGVHVELQGAGCSKHVVDIRLMPAGYGALANPG
jgi:hypothetical protein